MSQGIILLIILFLLLVAFLPRWPYSAEWGHYPSAVLGVMMVIAVILLFLTGRL